VRKTVYHFSKNLPKDDQINIDHCLDLIKFGMQSTLTNAVSANVIETQKKRG